MNQYKHFSEDEVRGLSPTLIALLDYARDLAGVPFVITSGFRTTEENRAAGGADNSAHLRGLAVDLRVHDSASRYKIIRALIKVGFARIVVYESDGHVHADIDYALPNPVFVVKP